MRQEPFCSLDPATLFSIPIKHKRNAPVFCKTKPKRKCFDDDDEEEISPLVCKKRKPICFTDDEPKQFPRVCAKKNGFCFTDDEPKESSCNIF